MGKGKSKAALRRPKPLQRILQRNSEWFSKYKQTIDNYIKQGYARKLTEEEREKVSSRTWYLHTTLCFTLKKQTKTELYLT